MMEIPVITRMSVFEAGINSLNSPSSLISRFPHRLWKWGALLLALVYTFSSVVRRIKFLILHYHNKSKSLLNSECFLSNFDDDFYSSDDDENDDVCSSSASSDDDEEPDELAAGSSYEDLTDFGVKGSFCNFGENSWEKRKLRLRRRRSSIGDNLFSLSDLVNGNGVVKLWDELGSSINSFSFLDLKNDGKISSIFGDFPAISMSPAVILSAGAGENGMSGLGLWDLRASRKSPAVHAEWRSDRLGRIVGVDAGRTGKVYVRDDVTMGLAVGDVRKMDTPLEDSTEYVEDTWWDADAVNITDED